MKITFFLFLFIIVRGVMSQEKEHVWKEIPQEEVPDSLKYFDAVYFEKNLKISNAGKASILTSYVRLAIINSDAAELFRRQMLYEFQNTNIVVFDARIHKPSGRIVDYSKESTIVDRFRGDISYTEKDVELILHELEAGDVLELAKRVDFNSYILSDKISFQDQYPVMKSKFSLLIKQSERLTYNKYNGNIDFQKSAYDGLTNQYDFTFGYLPGLQFEELAIPSEHVPFIKFHIRFKFHSDWDWRDGYKGFMEYYKNGGEHDLWTQEYFEVKFEEDTGTVDDKIFSFHQYVNEKYKLIPYNSESDAIKLKEFIKNEEIDEVNIYPLYRKIFRVLEKPYYVVFAESRYNGTLEKDTYYGTDETDVFFAFRNEQNNEWVYLYPKTNNGFYSVNELPSEILGTRAILVNEEEVVEVVLPDATDPNNRDVITNHIYINASEGTNRIESEYKFYGALSGMYRNLNDFELKKNKAIFPKSVLFGGIENRKYAPEYPYYFSFETKGIIKEENIHFSSDTSSLTLEGILEHQIIESPSEHAKLTMYPLSCYEDKQIIYITSEASEIELLSLHSLKYYSEIGYYSIKVEQQDPKTIKITSRYSIVKPKVDPDQFEELRKINTRYIEAKKLVISWM